MPLARSIRRLLICAALILPIAAATAQALAPPKDDDAIRRDIVLANHILVKHGVLDGFGHVSERSLANPDHFFIARSMAPALVTLGDIVEVDSRSCAVVGSGRNTYIERFIHCGIYLARPDVKAVVHDHAPVLIPYGVTRTALEPLYHVSGFLGEGTAFFDIRQAGGDGTDMLIKSADLGRALAVALGPRPIALMRGHGAALVGTSLAQVVYRAIYADLAAEMQVTAHGLGRPEPLTKAEAKAAADTNDQQLGRVWELWSREVADTRQ